MAAKKLHVVAPNRSHGVKSAKLLETKKQIVNHTASYVPKKKMVNPQITAAHPSKDTFSMALPKLIPTKVHLSDMTAIAPKDMCGCEAEHQCTCKSTMRALHCVVDNCMRLSCDCTNRSFVDACDSLANKCGNLDMSCSKARAVCESHTEHTGLPPERKRAKKGIPRWWRAKKEHAKKQDEEGSESDEFENKETSKAEEKKPEKREVVPVGEVVKSIHEVVEGTADVAQQIFEGSNSTDKEQSKRAKDEKNEKDRDENTQEAKKEEKNAEDDKEEGEERGGEEEAGESKKTSASVKVVVDEHEEFELNKRERKALDISKSKIDYEKVYLELYDLKERKCRLMFAMNDGWENLEDRLNKVLKEINHVLKELEKAGKKLPEMHCYKHFEEWHDHLSTTPKYSEAPKKSNSLRAPLAQAAVTAAVAMAATVTMIGGRP